MSTTRALFAVALALLAATGCDREQPQATTKPKDDLIHRGAVSDDGLAVGAGSYTLYISDGGTDYKVRLDEFISRLDPGPNGVWVVAGKAIHHVSRAGISEYPISDYPWDVLPTAGATAYIVYSDRIAFVGDGYPGPTKRRAWDDREPRPDDRGDGSDHYPDHWGR